MTLTVTALGWTFHVELSTDTGDDGSTDGGYDHDVVSASLDAEVDGDTACGFVAPSVEREL